MFLSKTGCNVFHTFFFWMFYILNTRLCNTSIIPVLYQYWYYQDYESTAYEFCGPQLAHCYETKNEIPKSKPMLKTMRIEFHI